MNPKAAALLLLPTLACAVGPNYTKPEIPGPQSLERRKSHGGD